MEQIIDIDFDINPNYFGLLDANGHELSPLRAPGYSRKKVAATDFLSKQVMLFTHTGFEGRARDWPRINYLGFFLTDNWEEPPFPQKHPLNFGYLGLALGHGDSLQLTVNFFIRPNF
jgi:hypothetical protein